MNALPSAQLARLTPVAAWLVGVAGAAGVAGEIAMAGRIGGADAPHLLGIDLRLGQLLVAGEFGHAARCWWALLAPQPPFGALLGTLTTVLTGGWPLSAALCMGLTLLLIFDALQRLSVAMTGGRLGGLLAWVAVLASPFTWSAVEQYSRDLSAAAAILQAVSHVATPAALQNRRAAIGFGAWMGFAFATKYTAPVFLLGPCLAVGAGLLSRRTRGEWRGLGVALLAFAAVGGVWYATHLQNVRGYLFTSLDAGAMQGGAASLRDVDSLAAKVYYGATLWEAMSAPGMALVVVGAGLGLWRPQSRVGVAVAGLGLLIGTVVLSRVSQQVDRYVYPGFILASTLLVPLGRGWVLPLLGLAVMTPRLVASAERFAPGQRGEAPSYAHGVEAFRATHWPVPATSFPASDFQPEAWNLHDAVAALKAVQGPDGTVGVLIPGGPAWPTFGHLMLPSVALGCRWDWASVNLRGGPAAGGVLMGPLFDGAWPSRDFVTLLALQTRPPDPQVSAWLQSHTLTERARLPTNGGGEFVVYSVR